MSVVNTDGLVIPVEINGIHVKMAIDTTGSISYLYSGAVAALALQPKNTLPSGVLRVGATAVTETVDIPSLKIGNLAWPRVNALVYPRTKEYSVPLNEDDVVGAVGLGMFAGLDFELDFAAHKFMAYSQKHCPGNVVYWSRNFDVVPLRKDSLGSSYIIMAANGMNMTATLATRSAMSSMEEGAAAEILGLDRSSAGVDADGGGDGCAFCGSITLQAEGLTIKNARVKMVRDIPSDCRIRGPSAGGMAAHYDCPGAFPLHIGLNVLSRLHLYFANSEKKLYFTDATATGGS